jgi:uncharacterized protein
MKIYGRKNTSGFMSGMSHLVAFCVTGFLPTLLIISVYFIGTGTPRTLLAWIYAASIPCYYFTAALILTMLLSPLYFLRHTRYLVIAPLVCMDFYLFLNLFIYDIYRFHLDAVFLYILVKDFYGIGVPLYIICLLALFLAAIILVNVFIFRRSQGFRKWPATVMMWAVALYTAGQFIHVWGAEFHLSSITRYANGFPYFYPIKASKLMAKLERNHLIVAPAPSGGNDLNIDVQAENDALSLNYPLKKIRCTCPPGQRPNILFFLLESWRGDMMNASITPVISGLAQKGYLFDNHLSGGNVTPTGLFSIMYGLHSTYMRYIDTDPKRYPPVFLSVLKENGYAASVYTSSNLKGFSLKEMFFSNIPVEEYFERYGSDNSRNDRLVIDKLIGSIKNAKPDTPFFKFVFLTASHHGYNYPKDQALFQPTSKESAFLFNKYADPVPLLNRYKNALHYNDSLFGEVLKALREAHLDKKTVIVISSDHGEEFNDKGRGYWGHGSDFTRYQSSVPLIIYFPGEPGGQVIHGRSSHIDVVPTLMSHLFTCGSPISDYSSGSDLFNLPEHRGLIVRSYVNKACIIDDTVYVDSIPLKRYFLDDVEHKSTRFDYKTIELMKLSESHFVRKSP